MSGFKREEMSKLSFTEQEALDAAVAAYRAARADAFTTRTIVAAAEAKFAKVSAEYKAADADYKAAADADNAAEAAVDKAFEAAVEKAFAAAANVYLEAQPWDCLSDADRAAIREYVTGDRTR